MIDDLRTALRQLRRAPGYAAIVVLTLGLGIGGVTAVFTLADPMIFRPLPYADSGRVVEVLARTKASDSGWLHADDFVAIAAHATTLEAVVTLGGPYVGSFRDSPDPVLGGGVTAGFERLTGLEPALGRGFAAEEYQRNENDPPAVTMLTWRFWREAFGASPDVVGSRLELGGRQPLSLLIVGVLPPEFFYPEAVNEAPAFIVPGSLDPRYLGRSNVYPTILARVRPGFTFAQVEAELDTLITSVERAHPQFEQGRKAHVVPLQDLLFRSIRTPLLLLFIATSCLMMLALVNLAHLAGARVQARAKDLAVRLSLGASRARVMRLLVAEAAVLAAAGAGVGLGVGQVLFTWGFSRTPRFSHLYRLLPAALDARVVFFTIAVAALGMIAVGVWPAWRAVRGDLRSTLSSLPGRRRGWRVGGESAALAGQTAFAVGLVVICLLVVRSFVGLSTIERGFDPGAVQLARLQMPQADPATTAARHRSLAAALRGVRGVQSAAVGNGVPGLTLPEGVTDASGQPVQGITAFQVSGGAAATLAMRLAEGRLFDDAEAFGGAPVAVIDRAAAERLWPGQRALGQTLRLRSGRSFVVIGVLGSVRWNLFRNEATGTALVTLDAAAPAVVNRLMVMLRFDPRRPPSPTELAAAARQSVPGITWTGTAGLSSWERLLGQPRFLASALGVLALLTALLAGFGVLGVVSHLVARRTREIGIRVALGAGRARVRMLVIRQAVVPSVVGVAAGFALAYWWSATVRAAIVGIDAHDPWSFAMAGAAALVTVVAASALPAVRASGIDPARTLRAE